MTDAIKNNKRKRPGRPSLPEENLKLQEIKLRLNAADFASILNDANACGMKVSPYCADLLLKKRPVKVSVPTEVTQLLSEISRLGTNLNQLAKSANVGTHIPNSNLLPDILQLHQKLHWMLIKWMDKR